MDPAQFKERIVQIFTHLESYSYYDLLNLPATASTDEIRGAFHRMALSMHPDRYHQHPDQDLTEKIYAIYKRLSEGYRVLTKPETRKAYDDMLAQNEGKRLVQKERKKQGPKRLEEEIEEPQARKFFTLAMAAEKKGDFKTARMNYKFALNLSENHPTILEKLQSIEGK